MLEFCAVVFLIMFGYMLYVLKGIFEMLYLHNKNTKVMFEKYLEFREEDKKSGGDRNGKY